MFSEDYELKNAHKAVFEKYTRLKKDMALKYIFKYLFLSDRFLGFLGPNTSISAVQTKIHRNFDIRHPGQGPGLNF